MLSYIVISVINGCPTNKKLKAKKEEKIMQRKEESFKALFFVKTLNNDLHKHLICSDPNIDLLNLISLYRGLYTHHRVF